MKESFSEHPNEEALERFLLNMSSEEELEDLEMHVLACGLCVDQLEAMEIRIAATRSALKSLESRRISPKSTEAASSRKRWFTIPGLSFAATGLVAAVGVVLFSIPQDVTLTAYRGSETASVSEGRPLHIHLNAAGLNSGAVAVELADRRGALVWKGTSVIRHDAVDVTLPRITESGSHYLRLYSTPSGANESVLLREFALKAHWPF